jgi:hypothetical protein
MKIFTVGLIIICALVISSMVFSTSTALQASSKGLNLYLTVDTNLRNQDIRIITQQYGNEIYSHEGFLHTGRNEYTLQYPKNVVDSGPFVICIDVGFEWLYCGDRYNAEEKRPENAYISAREYGLNEKIREEEQQEQPEEEQSQSQSQSQSQDQTVIVCPANARCIIEQ